MGEKDVKRQVAVGQFLVRPKLCVEILSLWYEYFTVHKRKRSTTQASGTNGEDDEPPELSRCPSPVDESVYPQLISTLPLPTKSSEYHENSSIDPPSLTRSLPDDECGLKNTSKAAGGRGAGSSETKEVVTDPREFVVTRSSVRRVGSPDDTLDSMSSLESNCECTMPTLIADNDSSYGSSCGRAGAPASDSETLAGSETETEKTGTMPLIRSCDVC